MGMKTKQREWVGMEGEDEEQGKGRRKEEKDRRGRGRRGVSFGGDNTSGPHCLLSLSPSGTAKPLRGTALGGLVLSRGVKEVY